MPAHVKSLGMSACSLTDHGVLAGTYRFWKACRREGVKPILGMEAYYAHKGHTVKAKDEDEKSYYHLVLLARNNRGLHNLFKLSTLAYQEGLYFKPRLDDELLAQYSGDLIATTACLGSRFAKLLLTNRTADAEYLVDHYLGMFGDRFLVELQPHTMPEQVLLNEALIGLAGRKGLPLIVSNDCHYTLQSDKPIHELALCLQTNQKLSDPKRFSFGDIDVHVCSEAHMKSSCIACNIPLEAIENTGYVADLITDDYFCDVKNRYPRFGGPIPPDILLASNAQAGLAKKFPGGIPSTYQTRLEEELLVVKQMGFSDYMLIVEDLIKVSTERGVLCGSGRGSSAGSLVSFAIGITQADPIKYGLLFSRFLNIGRTATPLLLDQSLIDQIESSTHTHSTCH